MTPEEFCERYQEQIGMLGAAADEPIEQIEQARHALGLGERDIVQGQYKVSVSCALSRRHF